MPHTVQNPCLFASQGTNLLIQQDTAVAVYGHQGRPKLVNALSKKTRAILVELLKLQVGVEETLQHVAALGSKLTRRLKAIKPVTKFMLRHQVIEEIVQHALIDRLEQNTQRSHRMSFQKWDHIFSINEKDVRSVRFQIQLWRKRQLRT